MKIKKVTDKYVRKSIKPEGVSRTKQSDAELYDPNVIMAKFKKTRVQPVFPERQALFGDFSSVPEFTEALNIVTRAQEQFAALPAKARARFGNDVRLFLDFIKPENAKELNELGLVSDEDYKASLSTPKVDSEGKPIFKDGKQEFTPGKALKLHW